MSRKVEEKKKRKKEEKKPIHFVPPLDQSSSHASANASLLALAPNTPCIKIDSQVYLKLITSTTATSAPSCCPSDPVYSQFLILGTKQISQDKLILSISDIVPFYNDSSIVTSFAAYLNTPQSTVLGWAVCCSHDTTTTQTHQPQILDTITNTIANSYFDLFHSTALTVLAKNCKELVHDCNIANLSKFCIEACTYLQDVAGLVIVNRNVMGSGSMVCFDTPELMPYDIERRLAVILPGLFAAIDTSSGYSAVNDTFPPEEVVLLPPSLPPLIKVRAVPHSCLSIINWGTGFIKRVAAVDVDNFGDKENFLDTKVVGLELVSEIKKQLSDSVLEYEKEYEEFMSMCAELDVLKATEAKEHTSTEAE